jgi:hypothetical protein
LRSNFVRASLYLAEPSRITLPYGPGGDSLEGRGAGWLFLKYLTTRFGGSLLRDLMSSSDEGALNITNHIRQSWESIIGDWFLAMFADDAPELATLQIDARFTYPGIDLRSELSSISASGSFPLQPAIALGDFVGARTLRASAPSYVLLSSQGTAAVAFSGALGAAFTPAAQAKLLIMRLQ